MPHALFTTQFGTCGIAWNENGLTSFQLPDDTAALTERSLAARGGTKPGEPPEWVRRIIARVQLHLEGKPQDFSGAASTDRVRAISRWPFICRRKASSRASRKATAKSRG